MALGYVRVYCTTEYRGDRIGKTNWWVVCQSTVKFTFIALSTRLLQLEVVGSKHVNNLHHTICSFKVQLLAQAHGPQVLGKL